MKYSDHEIDYEELKPYFHNKLDIIKKTFLLFYSNFKEFKYIGENLDRFIIENSVEVENYDIYKKVFKAIMEGNEKLPNRVLGNISYINKVNRKIDKIKSIPKLKSMKSLSLQKKL